MTEGRFAFCQIALVISAAALLIKTPSLTADQGLFMLGLATCIVWFFFETNRTRDGRPTLNLSQVRRDVVRIDLSIVGGWFVLYFFFKYQNAITPILRNLDQDIGLEKAFKTIRDIVG